MKTYVLLHFEGKNDAIIIAKFVYSYEPQVSRSVKFNNEHDVIFMFKMYWNIGFHGINILKYTR